jgi:N-acyl homoserine lactone hydrolase
VASLDRLDALEKSGVRIYFGHDPEFWRSVPQAHGAIA